MFVAPVFSRVCVSMFLASPVSNTHQPLSVAGAGCERAAGSDEGLSPRGRSQVGSPILVTAK